MRPADPARSIMVRRSRSADRAADASCWWSGSTAASTAARTRAFRNYAGDVRSLVSGRAGPQQPPLRDPFEAGARRRARRPDPGQRPARRRRATRRPRKEHRPPRRAEQRANGWLVTAFQFRADAIGRIAEPAARPRWATRAAGGDRLDRRPDAGPAGQRRDLSRNARSRR